MNLFISLQQAVQSDLTIGSESTLYPVETIRLALNRAYKKAGGMFRWAELEDAKKTSTQANIEYYDYPSNWRPNSIWKLTVDGVDYGDPVVFKDYLYEKENTLPSGKTKLWANQWRRYFIYPTPTAVGDNNIVVWGVRVVDELTEDADVTIFSYSMPECNEAIVLEAVAILKSKGEEENKAAFRSMEAKTILTEQYRKIRGDQAKYEKTTSYFDVPDYFGNMTSDRKEGNF